MSPHPHSSLYEALPARSPYHARLPVGERVSVRPLLDSPYFGFEGDLQMARLEPMLVPKVPRHGEAC